jgi:hypothetical protein
MPNLDTLALWLGRSLLIVGGLVVAAWLAVCPAFMALDRIYRRGKFGKEFVVFLVQRRKKKEGS